MDIPLSHVTVDHHIQRRIVLQLYEAGRHTYQSLKPDGLEGNAYNYHLRHLRKLSVIEVGNGIYRLTPRGLLLAESFSLRSAQLMFRPQMYMFLLIINDNHILLYTPRKLPTPGMLCLPNGDLHFNDTLLTTIQRLARRRGVDPDDFSAQAICPVNLRYVQNNTLVMQRAGQLWRLDHRGNRTVVETPNGISRWYALDTLQTRGDVSPEVMLALDADRGRRAMIDEQIDL